MAVGDLLTADYQIEYNGLVLGAGTNYDIVGIIGFGTPPVRSVDVSRQDDHGSYPSRRELMSSRTINMEIDVIATDISDLHTKINILKRAFAVSDSIRAAAFRIAASGWGAAYGSDVITFGYVRQLTMNIGETVNYNTVKCYIQFECPDPRVYGETEQTASVSPGSATGGWTFPWTFPWTFGSVTSAIATVTNNGFMDTFLTAQFNGPSVSPRIENLNTGEYMQIDLTIDSGDYLLVSFQNRTALLNGTADRYNQRRAGSTWFPIRPGVSPLQYSIASGSGSVDLRWRDAYL